MAKFLPVIGEVVTCLESNQAAGITAPFSPETGKKLLDSAGDAWVKYKDENAIACAVRGDGPGFVRGLDGFS